MPGSFGGNDSQQSHGDAQSHCSMMHNEAHAIEKIRDAVRRGFGGVKYTQIQVHPCFWKAKFPDSPRKHGHCKIVAMDGEPQGSGNQERKDKLHQIPRRFPSPGPYFSLIITGQQQRCPHPKLETETSAYDRNPEYHSQINPKVCIAHR